MAASDDDCPDFVRGAKLTVTDVPGGVAFRFTAGNTTYVQPLRALLREAAVIVERHAQEISTRPIEPDAVAIPAVTIDVRDVPSGALVTIRPQQADNLDLLRLQARGVEAAWQASTCINGPMAVPQAAIAI